MEERRLALQWPGNWTKRSRSTGLGLIRCLRSGAGVGNHADIGGRERTRRSEVVSKKRAGASVWLFLAISLALFRSQLYEQLIEKCL